MRCTTTAWARRVMTPADYREVAAAEPANGHAGFLAYGWPRRYSCSLTVYGYHTVLAVGDTPIEAFRAALVLPRRPLERVS